MPFKQSFFDPDGSFRELWNSIPPKLRMRDYLCEIAHRDRESSAAVLTLVDTEPARDRAAEPCVPASSPARLLLKIGDRVEDVNVRFELERLSPAGVRIMLVLGDRKDWPDAPTACTLLLLEPSALESAEHAWPGSCSSRNCDWRPAIGDLFADEALNRYQVALFLSGLPAIEGTLDTKGVAEFRVDVTAASQLDEISRIHLVAVFESAPLAPN